MSGAHVSISGALHARLSAAARARGVSLASLVEAALADLPPTVVELTAAERADPAAWFEGRNVAALRLGAPDFEGAEHFGVADPDHPATTDVIRCLP